MNSEYLILLGIGVVAVLMVVWFLGEASIAAQPLCDAAVVADRPRTAVEPHPTGGRSSEHDGLRQDSAHERNGSAGSRLAGVWCACKGEEHLDFIRADAATIAPQLVIDQMTRAISARKPAWGDSIQGCGLVSAGLRCEERRNENGDCEEEDFKAILNLINRVKGATSRRMSQVEAF